MVYTLRVMSANGRQTELFERGMYEFNNFSDLVGFLTYRGYEIVKELNDETIPEEDRTPSNCYLIRKAV